MNRASLVRLICTACVVVPGLSAAADPQRQLPPPRLEQIVSGKMDLKDGKPRLILMIDSYRRERIRIENTRRVVRIDEAREEGGEEQVTVIEGPVTQEQEIVRIKPAGLKPTVVDLNDVKFFDINWKAVSIEQASQKLKAVGPVFLLDGNRSAGPFSPSQLRALNADTLILKTPKRIRQSPRRNVDPFADPFGGNADPFGA